MGSRSVDDVLYIKSLVAERVKEGGTLILNADDERLAKLMECGTGQQDSETSRLFFTRRKQSGRQKSFAGVAALPTSRRSKALIEAQW